MRKIIKFGPHVATIERIKTAFTVMIDHCNIHQLTNVADAINEHAGMDVLAISSDPGKVVVIVEPDRSNADIVDAVCDSLSRVFDTDIVLTNEKAEEFV